MYLGRSELNFWVVLNLPQSFVEAFPLVGFGILLLVGLVRKDVFRAKKRAVREKMIVCLIKHVVLCNVFTVGWSSKHKDETKG